ncbi:hypothetical protein [Formosa algae]|uniref:hypothetical protein n=1 Tax=Formosa algae TaxID=225843 RepID=UPI000CCF7517|nr:hypothetical protein [Formosa algae]PNW29095.1 hypothetical protein BKP44_05760 [Formosa algae]
MKLLIMSVLIFTICTKTIAAQQSYKDAAGFYNLSAFEMASGLYLLENKTFFYYASFGNADLKLYGTYTIENQKLHLKTDENLNHAFYVYGSKHETTPSEFTLEYGRPYNGDAEDLMVKIDEEVFPLPKFTAEQDSVSITLKMPKNQVIDLALKKPERQYYEGELHDETPLVYESVQLTTDTDKVLVYHNYYYDMTTQISQIDYGIQQNTLTLKDNLENKTVQKKEITKDVEVEILAFIENLKSKYLNIVIDEKTYYKL